MAKKRKSSRASLRPKSSGDDPFAWLKDRAYPKLTSQRILAFLKSENTRTQRWFRPHTKLVNALYREMKDRLPKTDEGVPVKDGLYDYSWRYRKGHQYRVWVRRRRGALREEIVLDENQRAKGKTYYALGAHAISPDHRFVAFSEDVNGSERYTVRIKDLTRGTILSDTISNTMGHPEWAADSKSFFYLELNPEWRPFRVRHHVLGHDITTDAIVYQEQDARFFVDLGKSQSRQFIFITSGDYETSETRFLPAATPSARPKLIAKRRRGHRYSVDHGEQRFFILTNDRHKNFRLVSAPEKTPQPRHWRQVVAPSSARYLKSFVSFKKFVALKERRAGIDGITVLPVVGKSFAVHFPDCVRSVTLGPTAEYDVSTFRIIYESPITPLTVYDYSITARQLVRRKVQNIPSGYNRSSYETRRVMTKARDGTKVPITLLYKKKTKKNFPAPLHLYGYGAYGIAMTPHFSTAVLSLVNRGFIYAVAHVRGGDEMGQQWYEDGKLWKRKNTFYDFIDCARSLVRGGFARAGNISIEGGSAGGSLMGFVVNAQPKLWKAAILAVPFVDVLNTMLDPRLPLTPIEWGEWGNPITSQRWFAFIKSWSPYDNITAQDYPAMLVTGGLHDPRVTYWEPAKWVARIRANSTSGNVTLLKTNMSAGHGGRSGRFERLKEVAEEYAFLLTQFRTG